MASAFGHAFAAFAIGKSYAKNTATRKFFILGVICSILPDADVISFALGIPYESFWGHRGFTHSLVFSLLLGVLVAALFYGTQFATKQGLVYSMFFSLCTASHGLLDALTSGGLGVAFFAPFDNERYFLPWRPIKVSPIGLKNFFSGWGLTVLASELIWIGIPGLLYIWMIKYLKKPAQEI